MWLCFSFVLCAALQEQVGVGLRPVAFRPLAHICCALHDSISIELWRLVHLIQL